VIAFFSHEKKIVDEELNNFLMSIGSQMGQFMARKSAETERESIGKELVLILDSTSEGIYVVDLAGSITFINRSAARALGLSPERVVGKNSHTLFHHTRSDGTPCPEFECPLTQLLQAGRSHSIDPDYFCRIDGSQLAVSYSAVPMFEGAFVSGAVIDFTDISEKCQMEIELPHAQKLEAVGGLAAGIAHDITNRAPRRTRSRHVRQSAATGELRLLRRRATSATLIRPSPTWAKAFWKISFSPSKSFASSAPQNRFRAFHSRICTPTRN
jgi:PAS domain S-box-containing protein